MKTKMHSKAIWALLLCAAMVLTMIPVGALPVKATETSGVTYLLNDDFDTLDAGWNNTAATVTEGIVTTCADSRDLRWTFSTAITENYTVEFKYQLDAVRTDSSSNQETCTLKIGSTHGEANSQVHLKFTGAVDGASSKDRVVINSAYTPQFETYGAWHEVKIVVDQETNTFQLFVDGDPITYAPTGVEPTTHIPFYNTEIAEMKSLFFDCDTASNISIDYVKVYTGEPETEPTEPETEPAEPETEPSEPVEPDPVPEGSYFFADDFSNFAPSATMAPGWYGSNITGDSESEDVKILSGQTLRYYIPEGLNKNFTVEFEYVLSSGITTEITFGSGDGSGTAAAYLYMSGGNASADHRTQINGQNAYYINGYGERHTAKIVVNIDEAGKKTCQFWFDDKQAYIGTTTVFDAYKDQPVQKLNFKVNGTDGQLLIDNFKVYTNDMAGADSWTVEQQATLGENIHMNFTGTVGALTGIESVRATLGDVTKTDVDMSNGFAVTIPVAAAQMAETITLEGLNAAGTAVLTKTYTVEAYLNDLGAEGNLGELVKHTLNYGAAAATYFGQTTVTAPTDLTMAAVSIPKGNNYAVMHDSTRYGLANEITEDYTLEFKYMITGNVSFELQVSNGNPTSATTHAYLVFDATTDTHTIKQNKTGGTKFEGTHSQWHTVTVEVNQTEDTYVVYVDGQNINMTTRTTYCLANSKPDVTSVKSICFTKVANSGDGTILVDDVTLKVGDNEVFNESFDSFEMTKAYWGGEPQGGWWYANTLSAPTATLEAVAVSPVSGECTGLTAKSATLLFKDKVEIRYSFELAAGGNIADYAFSLDGAPVAPVLNGDRYYVYSGGINPQMYETDVELTVTKGGETMTVTYSPMDYMERMNNKEDTAANMKSLVQAMYNYYLAATAYLANPNG